MNIKYEPKKIAVFFLTFVFMLTFAHIAGRFYSHYLDHGYLMPFLSGGTGENFLNFFVNFVKLCCLILLSIFSYVQLEEWR